MQYLIGVDIGTQGTKAALFDTDLNAVASAFRASVLVSPIPGTVWQEADDIYSSCADVIRELMEKADVNPADIAGIGIDGQMAGIMGIDDDGEAVTYYDSWLDQRCGKYMDMMRKMAGRRITEITGGPVTYTHGPKIMWWKHEQPGAYEKIRKFVLPHSYVAGKMCGLHGDEAYFDYTCLQYSLGDNEGKKWSDELLEEFEIDAAKMPRIVSPFDTAGYVTENFARLTGLAEGTPVAAGGGDTAVSVFGSGMFDPGDTLDCAGTASVLCTIVDKYRPDTENETLTMVRTPVDGLWMPLAYISGGGLCIRWFRDNLSGFPACSYADLEAEAERVPAGSEGLMFVPHFAGRVLPSDRYVKGSFTGLDWKHTRAHMYRSIMESIAYEYRFYLDALRSLYPGMNADTLSVIGGGSKSGLFNRIKADVLGMRTVTYETGDTALCGSAVIAGVSAGVYDDYKTPILRCVKRKKEYEPDRSLYDYYGRRERAYLEILEALRGVYSGEIYR